MNSKSCCKKAMSEAIHKTVSMVESEFGIQVRRSPIPSESRENLLIALRRHIEQEVIRRTLSKIQSATGIYTEGQSDHERMTNLMAVLEDGFDEGNCREYYLDEDGYYTRYE